MKKIFKPLYEFFYFIVNSPLFFKVFNKHMGSLVFFLIASFLCLVNFLSDPEWNGLWLWSIFNGVIIYSFFRLVLMEFIDVYKVKYEWETDPVERIILIFSVICGILFFIIMADYFPDGYVYH